MCVRAYVRAAGYRYDLAVRPRRETWSCRAMWSEARRSRWRSSDSDFPRNAVVRSRPRAQYKETIPGITSRWLDRSFCLRARSCLRDGIRSSECARRTARFERVRVSCRRRVQIEPLLLFTRARVAVDSKRRRACVFVPAFARLARRNRCRWVYVYLNDKLRRTSAAGARNRNQDGSLGRGNARHRSSKCFKVSTRDLISANNYCEITHSCDSENCPNRGHVNE